MIGVVQRALHGSRSRLGGDLGRVRRYFRDGSYEPIPSTRNRLQEARALWGVLEDVSNLTDCGIDAGIRIDKNILSPNPIADLIACNELAPLLHQKEEDFHRNAFELEAAA
jgi:hypothetical protein